MLHVILGHIPEEQIKRIVRYNVLDGLKFTYDQIKHLKLGLCPSCIVAKMRAFPIYRSLSNIQYGIFECIFGWLSLCGIVAIYGMKHKDELLSTLKLLAHQYGPTRNTNSLQLTYLNCDSGSEQLE